MVIGRGRRREHPNQQFVLLLLRKKYGKKVRGNKVRGKKYGGKKYGGKSRDVTSGQACARYHFRLFPIAPPQMLLENRLYTTHIYTSNHKTF
jgi:hypothetical protein